MALAGVAMSGRLPQRRIDALVNHVDGVFVNNTTTVALAREVKASRKLIADLRALPDAMTWTADIQAMIDEAGL